MNHLVPGYLSPFVMTGMVVVATAVLLIVRAGLQRAEWPARDQAKAFWSVASLLIAWFAVAIVTSFDGFYRPPAGSPPTIQYGLLAPVVLGVLLFWAWPLLRRTIGTIRNTQLVGVQTYRVLGVVFLLLYAGGHLPGLFALPAGLGDSLVGIFAPFAAAAYARSPETAAGKVRLWNLLGIADLVIAVTLGFLTSPSPFQLAAFDRPSVLIAMYPLVLIPVFAVPLSLLLHMASLRKLRQDQAASRTVLTPEAIRTSAIG